MNNVISFSGGKDSTAMLHLMLDRGESIHSVLFFDTVQTLRHGLMGSNPLGAEWSVLSATNNRSFFIQQNTVKHVPFLSALHGVCFENQGAVSLIFEETLWRQQAIAR